MDKEILRILIKIAYISLYQRFIHASNGQSMSQLTIDTRSYFSTVYDLPSLYNMIAGVIDRGCAWDTTEIELIYADAYNKCLLIGKDLSEADNSAHLEKINSTYEFPAYCAPILNVGKDNFIDFVECIEAECVANIEDFIGEVPPRKEFEEELREYVIKPIRAFTHELKQVYRQLGTEQSFSEKMLSFFNKK